MKTAADIQAYLLNMNMEYEEPREGTWVLSAVDSGQNLAITLAGPVIVFRVKVMEIPRHNREELFRTLLELNATEMMHGAYGIEGDAVIIADALQLENLDYNEFAATVDDITLAVASHHGRLAKFREAA
jgi:Tir chaperone family protein CesT